MYIIDNQWNYNYSVLKNINMYLLTMHYRYNIIIGEDLKFKVEHFYNLFVVCMQNALI